MSAAPPTIHTELLILRPFAAADAPAVQRYAGEREIAATTLAIPHPYPEGGAAQWIATHRQSFDEGRGVVFAIELKAEGSLVGAIDLRINREHKRAEMGYVVYRPWWGRGIATEAARATLKHGFGDLGLNRIEAHHFANNPASGQVLRKLGMHCEGTMRQHVCKWGEFIDTVHYAILRGEYDEAARQAAKR